MFYSLLFLNRSRGFEINNQSQGGGVVVLPIIGNPLSTTLTEEEEAGFIEVLKANQRLAFVADHAYRGYNKMGDVNDQGGLTVRMSRCTPIRTSEEVVEPVRLFGSFIKTRLLFHRDLCCRTCYFFSFR